jgi:hypothetical protein
MSTGVVILPDFPSFHSYLQTIKKPDVEEFE